MIRETSLEVYKNINENGLLSKRRLEVYNILYEYGTLTSAEVFKVIQERRNVNGLSQSRARFTELRDMGVIKECGTKLCGVTGNNVIAWRTTNGLPIALVKKTKKQKINSILKDVKKLGEDLPEKYKQPLRDIYYKIESM